MASTFESETMKNASDILNSSGVMHEGRVEYPHPVCYISTGKCSTNEHFPAELWLKL